MAEDLHSTLSEFHRIKAAAAELRAQAIRAQIASALTLCGVAETELRYGLISQSTKVTEKLRRLAESVQRHLNEPDHVPPGDLEKLRTELAELESRIQAVEQREQR